jgi:IS1 family transposase
VLHVTRLGRCIISAIITLLSIYSAYFHPIVKHGIIFWGNSSNSRRIFILQKKIIKIRVGEFTSSKPIYILFNELVSNQENFQTNSSIHSINTRSKHNLHRPTAKLSCFQKSAFYSGIRIFNSLPRSITNLKNEKTQFKVALKRYLNAHSFYSVDEFLTCMDDL